LIIAPMFQVAMFHVEHSPVEKLPPLLRPPIQQLKGFWNKQDHREQHSHFRDAADRSSIQTIPALATSLLRHTQLMYDAISCHPSINHGFLFPEPDHGGEQATA